MIGICIGSGEGWSDLATVAAERMEVLTGMKCFAWSELDEPGVHPSWWKCQVAPQWPGEDEFLVFDADIVPISYWQPSKIFEMMGRRFIAVPEENRHPVLAECARMRLPWPDWYVNGGLLMFGREHQAVWDWVWERRLEGYGSWLEQTALNEALYRTQTEVVRLPRMFNSMAHGQRDVEALRHKIRTERLVNLHLDSIGDAHELKRIIYKSPQALLVNYRGPDMG